MKKSAAPLNPFMRHRDMVLDPYRTPPLDRAIKAAVSPRDVVLDLGCGLGILSFLAVRYGAAKVYAVEPDKPVLKAARALAKTHDPEGKILFLDGLSYDQVLPEKVDLIVCEIVGSLAFEENILAALKDAKKRFLKPNGKIIPQTIELWGALASEEARYEGWADVAGLDLRAVTPAFSDWKAIAVSPKDLLSPPQRLIGIDTKGPIKDRLRLKATFPVSRSGTLGGLLLWPRVTWWGSEITDAAPHQPLTHWKQGYLPLPAEAVKTGATYQAEIIMQPHPKTPETNTEILWRLTRE